MFGKNSRLGRFVIRRASKFTSFPLATEVEFNLGERPHYTYCVYHAAQLARRLGLSAISAIEFGVAGGNGLMFLDRIAPRIRRELGIEVQVWGFDTGAGLPALTASEDLPYWFQASQYRMDVPALQAKLSTAKLVLGNVKETVGGFFEQYHPAPVGAILNDLDLYTSTRDSLQLFDADPAHFLPRVFIYLDDVVGTELEMYSACNGQLLAINDFNRSHPDLYIGLNQNLLWRSDVGYRHQIYYAHLRSHPHYAQYIGGQSQIEMESLLRLKSS